MLDVAVIDDPAAAEVTLDPMRARLLAELVEPASATMLAARVGLARQKVNYHLRELERHGLIELVEERRKGNVHERLLQATAAAYVISPAALASVAPDPARSPDRLSARWLLAVAGRLVQDVGTLIVGATKARKRLATFAMDGQVRFATAADLAATPEQVWEAIATGPGIDSWFLGRNQVEPGEGGTVRTAFGDYAPESTVTAWEPPRRFAYRSGRAEDGRFIAYEFLVEGRGGGSTVLRMVTSGFVPGDDWEDEFEAMTKGGEMFFRTLVEYLTRFPGRTATPITVFGPPASADWEHARAVLSDALGLTGTWAEGDRVRFTPDGLEPVDGSGPGRAGGRGSPNCSCRYVDMPMEGQMIRWTK